MAQQIKVILINANNDNLININDIVWENFYLKYPNNIINNFLIDVEVIDNKNSIKIIDDIIDSSNSDYFIIFPLLNTQLTHNFFNKLITFINNINLTNEKLLFVENNRIDNNIFQKDDAIKTTDLTYNNIYYKNHFDNNDKSHKLKDFYGLLISTKLYKLINGFNYKLFTFKYTHYLIIDFINRIHLLSSMELNNISFINLLNNNYYIDENKLPTIKLIDISINIKNYIRKWQITKSLNEIFDIPYCNKEKILLFNFALYLPKKYRSFYINYEPYFNTILFDTIDEVKSIKNKLNILLNKEFQNNIDNNINLNHKIKLSKSNFKNILNTHILVTFNKKTTIEDLKKYKIDEVFKYFYNNIYRYMSIDNINQEQSKIISYNDISFIIQGNIKSKIKKEGDLIYGRGWEN